MLKYAADTSAQSLVGPQDGHLRYESADFYDYDLLAAPRPQLCQLLPHVSSHLFLEAIAEAGMLQTSWNVGLLDNNHSAFSCVRIKPSISYEQATDWQLSSPPWVFAALVCTFNALHAGDIQLPLACLFCFDLFLGR